ncbi:MAG: hypothetical protein IJ570_02115 [Prevotella sp.]|nr:hypothetical protein [Prevotella sp.]
MDTSTYKTIKTLSTMKLKIYIAIILLLECITLEAQVCTNIFANSQTNEKIASVPSNCVYHLGSMNIDQLLLEDEQVAADSVGLERFGKAFESVYSMEDGVWTQTLTGRVWMISFEAENAYSMNLVFDHVVLSSEAEVYVTDSARNVVFGPVTAECLHGRSTFLSDIIPGSQINVYLYEPTNQMGQSTLNISKVVYGYKADAIMALASPPTYDGDIVLYPLYSYYADGFGSVITASGTHKCSGALVMTTDHSFRPFFLTSFRGSGVGSVNLENALFKFHVRRTLNYGALTQSYSYYGATERAFVNLGTFLSLLELDDDLKNNKDLTWLGWDRSGVTPSSGIILYHRYQIEKLMSVDSSFGVLNSYQWYLPSIFSYDFKVGDVLLDNNCRLVGLLRKYSDSNPVFSRFDYSWDHINDPAKSLYSWLDPIGTNQMTIDACKPLSIEGPTIPCDNSIYEIIPGLPDGYTVQWGFRNNSSLADDILSMDSLQSNQCLIETGGNHINDTLYAEILLDGIVVQTLEKKINTSDGFVGHVSGIKLANTSVPYLGLIDGGTYEGTAGGFFSIYSDQLPNCSVYIIDDHMGYPYHNTNSTSMSFRLPLNEVGTTLTVHVVSDVDCTHFVMYIKLTSTILIRVENSDSACEVSLVSELENGETIPYQDGEDMEWDLKIVDSATGNTKYESNVKGNSTQVNTSEWPSGVYVVQGKVGDEILSKKISK